MIYIVGRAHKASVKDGAGILYQRNSKNGIVQVAAIIFKHRVLLVFYCIYFLFPFQHPW